MGNQFSRKPIEWNVNENGCHVCISHSKDKTGYIRYRINGKIKRLHVVVWEQLNGPKPPNRVIMHTCDNPSCINPEHLRLGTQKENVADMINKNRKWIPIGVKNGRAKLTPENVMAILSDPRKQTEIAKEYGITQAHVSDIKLHKSWHDLYLTKKEAAG